MPWKTSGVMEEKRQFIMSMRCGNAPTKHRRRTARPACDPANHGRLEVEAQLRGIRPRRHVVRAAEGGQEVIYRNFVGQVDDGEPQAPFEAIPVEQIVVADAGIKEITRSYARRIVVGILGPRRGDRQKGRTIQVCGTQPVRTDRSRRCGVYGTAEQARLELLVWR